MKILFFLAGIFAFSMCEIFNVPKCKKNKSKGIYDNGIFVMQPLTGKTAERMNNIAIIFPRVGIIIYILCGIYIFWY